VRGRRSSFANRPLHQVDTEPDDALPRQSQGFLRVSSRCFAKYPAPLSRLVGLRRRKVRPDQFAELADRSEDVPAINKGAFFTRLFSMGFMDFSAKTLLLLPRVVARSLMAASNSDYLFDFSSSRKSLCPRDTARQPARIAEVRGGARPFCGWNELPFYIRGLTMRIQKLAVALGFVLLSTVSCASVQVTNHPMVRLRELPKIELTARPAVADAEAKHIKHLIASLAELDTFAVCPGGRWICFRPGVDPRGGREAVHGRPHRQQLSGVQGIGFAGARRAALSARCAG
jgi:hypothetical protein